MLTLGSQIASTVGCHPLNESFKVQILLRASNVNTEANSFNLFVTDFCCHAPNGSPNSLQCGAASLSYTWFSGLSCALSPVSSSGGTDWLGKHCLALLLRISGMRKHFSLQLLLKASFSFCYRLNHVFFWLWFFLFGPVCCTFCQLSLSWTLAQIQLHSH